MPLAHPTTVTTTQNYGPEMVVISFTTSTPGERHKDFAHRVQNSPQHQWGMRGDREHRTELIFDQTSVARMITLLADYVTES
jgi:hypothetical protein